MCKENNVFPWLHRLQCFIFYYLILLLKLAPSLYSAPLVISSQASTPTQEWYHHSNRIVWTGRRARAKPVGLLHQSLISKRWLCCSPAQLPDRRHKHTMALNMEIHRACEMFELWSHSFQHLSSPGVTPVACAEVGVGCNKYLSNVKSEQFFSSCIACMHLLVHPRRLEGACDKICVVRAVPSICPIYHGPCLAIFVLCALWITGHGPLCPVRIRVRVFLCFAPCHWIIPAQPATAFPPRQKGYFEVGGWEMLGGEGVYRGAQKRECNELFWEPQWWVMERACENQSQGGHLWLNTSVSSHTIVPFPISEHQPPTPASRSSHPPPGRRRHIPSLSINEEGKIDDLSVQR